VIPESSFLVQISLGLLVFHLQSFLLLSFNELFSLGFRFDFFHTRLESFECIDIARKKLLFSISY